jgi:hypothetical protein
MKARFRHFTIGKRCRHVCRNEIKTDGGIPLEIAIQQAIWQMPATQDLDTQIHSCTLLEQHQLKGVRQNIYQPLENPTEK